MVGVSRKNRCVQLAQGCDLFALTSVYENYSNAVLEAMAYGLPVIGTEVGYLQHLIPKAQAGMVVPSNNKDRLADALVEMANPIVRKRYAEHGRAFVEHLDWPIIAERLERLYLNVINGRVI